MPKDVNDRAQVNGARGGISEREVRSNGGEDSKLHYQERVAVIWIEKVKAMGSCALDSVERGGGSAEDRVILADMSNIGMFKRVHCQEHGIFRTFSFLFFTTFYVALPLHTPFS